MNSRTACGNGSQWMVTLYHEADCPHSQIERYDVSGFAKEGRHEREHSA